jgi:A/G-specific adenine glycosylase
MTLEISAITTDILKWHRTHGRQDMPWTKNRTAYRVWVSEIMLQQTQVSTAQAYYQRFMKQLPSLKKLANADEDEVLALWSGLGYYSRARNLHRSAKIIQTEHNGVFPNTLEGLVKLPGIGRSTAGAILSLAMKIPTPILDGNVKRILTRFYGIRQPVEQSDTQKKLWLLAAHNTPTNDSCVTYTQAIMDFGATQCQRRANCTTCPLQSDCKAYQTKTVDQLPNKTKKVRVATLNRPEKGIWASLWCPPLCDSAVGAWLKRHHICHIASQQPGPCCTHQLSHRLLQISTTLVNVTRPCVPNQMPDHTWETIDRIQLGLPMPVKKIIGNIVLPSINDQLLDIDANV